MQFRPLLALCEALRPEGRAILVDSLQAITPNELDGLFECHLNNSGCGRGEASRIDVLRANKLHSDLPRPYFLKRYLFERVCRRFLS